MAAIETVTAVAYLRVLERDQPEMDLVLIGLRGDAILAIGPLQIAEWLNQAGFPGTIAAGFIPAACSAAVQFAAEGEFTRWNVCQRFSMGNWILYHAFPDSSGRYNLGSASVGWNPSTAAHSEAAHRAGRLELDLPVLRRHSALQPGEGTPERPMAWEKSSARDELRKSLEELASLYESAGNDERATQLWEELSPLLLERPTVLTSGRELVFVDDDGREIDITLPSKKSWWGRIFGR